MREYGKIVSGYWIDTDPRITSMDDAESRLFCYLLTGPHTTALGCFHCPVGYIATDLRWAVEKASETLSKLVTKGLACRSDSGWVWLRKFLRHNKPENFNVWKHVHKLAKQIPADVPFREAVAKDCVEFEKWLANPSERVPEPSPIPEPEPSLNPTKIPPIASQSPPGANVRTPNDESFEAWWRIYPRKIGKGAARAGYLKALAKGRSAADLEAAAGRYRDSPSRDPKFTKHPATWLNHECWNDEENHESAKPVGRTGRFEAIAGILRPEPGVEPVGADAGGADAGVPGREIDGPGNRGAHGAVLRIAGPEVAGRKPDPSGDGQGPAVVEVLPHRGGNQFGAGTGSRPTGPGFETESASDGPELGGYAATRGTAAGSAGGNSAGAEPPVARIEPAADALNAFEQGHGRSEPGVPASHGGTGQAAGHEPVDLTLPAFLDRTKTAA